MDKISPLYSSEQRPLSSPLPHLHQALVWLLTAGQGYRWPLDALWRLVSVQIGAAKKTTSLSIFRNLTSAEVTVMRRWFRACHLSCRFIDASSHLQKKVCPSVGPKRGFYFRIREIPYFGHLHLKWFERRGEEQGRGCGGWGGARGRRGEWEARIWGFATKLVIPLSKWCSPNNALRD